MLCFIRSYVPDYDARIQKYFHACEENNIPYYFIGWARGGTTYIKRENFYIFESSAGVGKKWKSIFQYLYWYIFVVKCIYRERKNVKLIHCIDLDSGFIGLIISIIFNKKMIFDLYDQFSSSRGISGFFANIADFMERKIANYADLCIVAAPERYIQHGLTSDDTHVIVLENVPYYAANSSPAEWNKEQPLRLGYFGVLEREHRGLEDLMSVVKNRNDMTLEIAGYGQIEEEVKNYSANFNNIIYRGPLNHEDGLNLLNNAHVIVGFYYKTNRNHFYAAPNKYYEHLLLGRGLLTTIGTPPGNRVDAEQTGWAIEEGGEAISLWADSMTPFVVEQAGRNAALLWKSRFKNYFNENYAGLYCSKVRDLLKDNHAK